MPFEPERRPEPASGAQRSSGEGVKGGETMDTVYLITYRSSGAEGRRVLEVSTFEEVVPALLALGAEDAEEVEIFRAKLMKA